ncbi:MAG: PAS domain-containing protein [Spirochaetes bacterium]|nr:PAS domain-containing protein [Spirochaetota bacterium]
MREILYLVPPTGKANFNILNMAREGLKDKLAAMIHKAVRQKNEIFQPDLRIKYNNDFLIVDITVKPVKVPGIAQAYLLVVFKEKIFEKFNAEKKTGSLKEKKNSHAIDSLKQELQSTKEYLQSNIEELETSNEELKSMNEEMQSVNEEMQSTNEELETSKEELQSTNEELVTVNSELQNKVNQLSQINDDMNNLISATEIATIFLDAKLCFKWFTPAAAKIINLRKSDIGRPLDDLKTTLSDVDITLHAKNVLNDLSKVEMEILSNDHVWYSMRIMPYRTIENVIDGVVMTFVNIQKIKMAENVNRLGALLHNSLDAIMVANFDGKILAWNKGSENMYGWNEGEALNMNIDKILPECIMNEYSELLRSLKTGKIIKPFKTRRKAKDGKIINVWVIASMLTDENGNPLEIAFTERNMEWLAES